jgi:adenylate kinase
VRIVLLGAPGSGKGTQGERLAERLGVPHVSSGELLRTHIDGDTELGRQAADYVRRGELVPDDLVLAIVGEAVAAARDTGGYVLDGYPRSLAQAEQAYAAAEPRGDTADAAVYLRVSDDVARTRLAGRGEGRADDADPAVVERRLQVFHQLTEPLLEFYGKRGILVTVEADGSPDEVAAAIDAALAERS